MNSKNTLKDTFNDGIFCITLINRTDRRKKIAEQATKYKFNVKFHISELHENPKMGCLESHLSVLNEAKYRNLQNVLILEDDVKFLEFPYIPQFPDRWSMLYLGGNVQKVLDTEKYALWKRITTFTTHAYAVNCSMYDILIKTLTDHKNANTELAIDQIYSSVIHPNHLCYMLYPIIAIQDESYSDIEKKMVNYSSFINNNKILLHQQKRTLYMDEIFTINLFRRKDRIKEFDENFGKLGLKFNRWDGVDGTIYIPNKRVKHLFRNNDFQWRCGILGCAISHFELWKYLANSTVLDHIVIFEDDIQLKPTFIDEWKTYYDEIVKIDPDWEFIYIGGCHCTVDTPPGEYIKGSNNIITPADNVQMGLYSYCLSKEGARKLVHIGETKGIEWAIDWFVVHNLKHLKAYQIFPSLIYSFSGIDSDTFFQLHYVDSKNNEMKMCDLSSL